VGGTTGGLAGGASGGGVYEGCEGGTEGGGNGSHGWGSGSWCPVGSVGGKLGWGDDGGSAGGVGAFGEGGGGEGGAGGCGGLGRSFQRCSLAGGVLGAEQEMRRSAAAVWPEKKKLRPPLTG